MRDEKTGENPEARADPTDSTMPDCCGAMVERILRSFGRTAAEGAAEGESARKDSARWVRSCASMKEEMSSKWCGPSPPRTTGDD